MLLFSTLRPSFAILLMGKRELFALLNNYLDGEERAVCFTLFAFLMSVAFPQCAVGWSAVFDCGIS